jgi:TonB family protein
MPHALLLSPDDQAVSAITSVLEEMSVTCERPLDGPSAAKKLNSQSFDLVLVDCENLPAAKLIFDVCRRPKSGGNSVPIAIVDGRAGLPTAFRLGAELILTKPVAKDQARTTIRTAVNRLKKDEPARAIQPLENTPVQIAETAIPDVRAQAAAAPASSPPPQVAEAAPPVAAPEPPVAVMHSPVDAIAAASVAPKSQPAPSRDLHPPQVASAPSKPAPPSVARPLNASDGPVLADLDAENDSPTPVFTSYTEPRKKKGQGSLLALLFLLLAGGGFYTAWMYQPGFREMVQPQIDRVLARIGMPRPHQNAARQVPAPTPVKTPTLPTPATAAPSASASRADATVQSTDSPTTLATPTPAATKPPASEDPTKPAVVAAVPSDAELPGEKTAVILSSQGAERRLLYHLPASYPLEARNHRIEGTVVLKAVVSESGTVQAVRLIEGNPALAPAAINAVKQWRYRPYLRDGKAEPFQTIVLLDFQQP